MSAIFDFQGLLACIALFICTCTYLRRFLPSIVDKRKNGLSGTIWKAARIGERKSLFVSLFCLFLSLVNILPNSVDWFGMIVLPTTTKTTTGSRTS